MTETRHRPYIYILHGYSQVGKTTVARYLAERYGAVEVHPIGTWKRDLERYYGMEPGSLDITMGKNYIPLGMTITMQELMVRTYHLMKEADPYFSTRLFVPRMRSLLEGGHSVTVLSLRNLSEVTALISFLDTYPAVYIYLTRDSSIQESSDVFHDRIDSTLLRMCPDYLEVHRVENNYQTEEELWQELDRILE